MPWCKLNCFIASGGPALGCLGSAPPGIQESDAWVPICLVVWLWRLGPHHTPHTLTPWRCETAVRIHIIPVSAIFSKGLLRRSSAVQRCFFTHALSTVFALGMLALCCLSSYPSSVPDAGAIFVKIEHKTAGSSQCWAHTGASSFSWDPVFPSLLPSFTTVVLVTAWLLSCSRHSAAFLSWNDGRGR